MGERLLGTEKITTLFIKYSLYRADGKKTFENITGCAARILRGS